jgi:hypothetical protein
MTDLTGLLHLTCKVHHCVLHNQSDVLHPDESGQALAGLRMLTDRPARSD